MLLNSKAGITEPNGTIVATVLSATAVGTVSLTSVNNSFGTISGITATGGDIIVVTDPTVLTGAFSGNNLFFEVATNGGNATTRQRRDWRHPERDRRGQSAHHVRVGQRNRRNEGQHLTATKGAIELAAFNPAANVAFGGAATNFDTKLQSLINASGATSLKVGQYTDTPNGGTVATMTGSLSMQGSVNFGSIVLAAGALDIAGTVNAGTVLALGLTRSQSL